jgi:hypothetical protein
MKHQLPRIRTFTCSASDIIGGWLVTGEIDDLTSFQKDEINRMYDVLSKPAKVFENRLFCDDRVIYVDVDKGRIILGYIN